MPGSIDIGGRQVGGGSPCFVIAEVGVNHNGDPARANELVDVAARVGADAVKFQAFTPSLVASPNAPKAAYQVERDQSASQAEMLARLALDPATFADLKAHADAVGVSFISSAFDDRSVAMLEAIDVPALKIASGELTNLPLLETMAATGRPLLMSTGMADMAEVDEAVSAV
ncbi:MAG TPA: N-acetylneuraminate synthase family protein, partial [Candidatus Binatus sp.]|nr:N-acetylneuraminate synthase family protein [Candidatus Binatus sp.]